ncbi:hypothetical protein FA10DRAFT_257916 [Acaromyces ingoldii]|uniref:Uncharacterized protein n=1 Tax=Acaromyces ingoldii TaxID=215250 RepID=A0A316YWM5_9BASI|nr:hypothetical protein FA10DRAFT_257916 [Acaromyces ingoldii]PWN93669.1 hypothetical protein FA10DRAFT_257916 [Acaromyces ingoldii]
MAIMERFVLTDEERKVLTRDQLRLFSVNPHELDIPSANHLVRLALELDKWRRKDGKPDLHAILTKLEDENSQVCALIAACDMVPEPNFAKMPRISQASWQRKPTPSPTRQDNGATLGKRRPQFRVTFWDTGTSLLGKGRRQRYESRWRMQKLSKKT